MARSTERASRPKVGLRARRARWLGYAYISPWLVGFSTLVAGPLLFMFYLSFTNFHFAPHPQAVGLANYRHLVRPGGGFAMALGVTLLFALLSVPAKLCAALGAASLLNGNLRGIGLYRGALYLPSLVGGSVAVAVMWREIFGARGLLDLLLHALGLPSGNWVADPRTALLTIVLLNIWQFGTPMLVFLAGLRQVPRELHEAAAIDGASRWQRFRSVTIPMISPVILFNLIIEIIGTFKVFTQPYIVTGGGPLDRTTTVMLYIYNQAFDLFHMGLAAAASWLVLVVVGVLTALNFLASQYWVHYETRDGRP